MQRKLKVYQLATNPVCAPYRMIYPGNALNRLGDVEVKLLAILGQGEFDEVVREADLFIIQRMAMVENLGRIIDALNRKGIIVVYEIDDDLLNLDPASRFASLVPKDFARPIESCIRACQCVQCSTRLLAASLATVHPEVAVLENQLDHVPPFQDKATRDGTIVVGYAAGEHHGHDWAEVRSAYNRTIAELKSAGVQVETWIVGDRDIFASVDSPRKRFFPTMPRSDYLQFLAQIDVSIIPLRDSVFNRAKSDIKYLESASMGTPVVASHTAYGGTIKNEESGLLFRDAEEFAGQLKRLVIARSLAGDLARSAHRYVLQNRMIDQHVSKWAAAYQGWYARRSELLKRT